MRLPSEADKSFRCTMWCSYFESKLSSILIQHDEAHKNQCTMRHVIDLNITIDSCPFSNTRD